MNALRCGTALPRAQALVMTTIDDTFTLGATNSLLIKNASVIFPSVWPHLYNAAHPRICIQFLTDLLVIKGLSLN